MIERQYSIFLTWIIGASHLGDEPKWMYTGAIGHEMRGGFIRSFSLYGISGHLKLRYGRVEDIEEINNTFRLNIVKTLNDPKELSGKEKKENEGKQRRMSKVRETLMLEFSGWG